MPQPIDWHLAGDGDGRMQQLGGPGPVWSRQQMAPIDVDTIALPVYPSAKQLP